jgi:hypothetical protein
MMQSRRHAVHTVQMEHCFSLGLGCEQRPSDAWKMLPREHAK